MHVNRTIIVVAALATGAMQAQVGKKSTLTDLECQAVTCRVSEGMQQGLATIEIQGRAFSKWAGYSIRMRLVRQDDSRKVLEDRKVGVFADGHFTASVPAYNYPDGKYNVVFTPISDDRNVIAEGRYSKQGSDRETPPSRSPGGEGASGLAGNWRGINGTAGLLVMRPDGTYDFNGAGGRYSQHGNDFVFSGPLAAWNNGHATLNRGVIEFYWATRSGAKQWFTFSKE